MQGDTGAASSCAMFGNYRILETVGQGGMGVVYRAVDVSLERTCALKVLREHLRGHSNLIARFYREAEAVAQLDHPNIVHIYSVGSVGNIPYMAMEYLESEALSRILERENHLDVQRALYLAEQVARALACAHEARIIHRDIKPGNILIGADDHVHVLDFGIAKLLSAEVQLTLDGSRLGTPQYMSPERCQNKLITASSDIYSLGVVLFQMISGRLPYEASTPVSLIRKIIAGPPTRLKELMPDVPRDVERLVAFMIEKDPKDRPANAEALADAIARVSAGESLDEAEGMADVFASFRQTMGTPTPLPAEKHIRSARRPLLPRALRERFQKTRHKLIDRMLLLAVVGAALAATLAIGGLAFSRARWAAPHDTVYGRDHGIHRWAYGGACATWINEAQGIILAPIHLPGFHLKRAGWPSGGSETLVEFAGQSDTAREGQYAVYALDPAGRQARISFAPVKPVDDARREPALCVLTFGPHGAHETAWQGRALLRYIERENGTGPPVGSLLSYMCEPARPATHSVLTFPREAGPGGLPPAIGSVEAADVRADGRALAIACATERGDAWEIAQVAGFGKLFADTYSVVARTVVPVRQLNYSPDGSQLTFLCDAGRSGAKLLVAPADGSNPQGRLLAAGDLQVAAAPFSPDGRRLAVAFREKDGTGVLRLIRSDDGAVEAELGAAASCAWDFRGERLVVTAKDRKGLYQVWAVDPRPPHQRVQLTYLGSGTIPDVYVSPDGAWALTSLAETGSPTLVFISLSRVRS